MLKEKVNIQRGNTKLGKVLNVSLPPGRTCASQVPCFNQGCYARKFYHLRGACRNAWDQNYALAMTKRDFYFEFIRAMAALGEPELFRWHVSGDIPDADYLVRMVAVAQACPKTRFLCFTKQYAMVVVHRRLCKPWASNLNIVVSAWPGLPIPAELRSFPTAWMRDRKNPDPRIPADAVECDGGCDTCGLCWMLEPGRSVVFDKH